MKKLVLATVAAVALASGAQAADLGTPRMPIATAVVAPAYSWTGFYVGAQIGYGWGPAYQFDATPARSPSFNMRGVVGGVTVGYNYQINNIVVGAEGDLSLSTMRSAFTTQPGWGCGGGNCVNSINWFGTMRLRAGVAVERALLYVTGGVAIAGLNDYIGVAIACPLGFCGSTAKAGWTVGGGAEYMFAPNWTAKAEYLYMNFGSTSYGTASGFGSNHQAHIVRVGVNYLFSTAASAVVARY